MLMCEDLDRNIGPNDANDQQQDRRSHTRTPLFRTHIHPKDVDGDNATPFPSQLLSPRHLISS